MIVFKFEDNQIIQKIIKNQTTNKKFIDAKTRDNFVYFQKEDLVFEIDNFIDSLQLIKGFFILSIVANCCLKNLYSISQIKKSRSNADIKNQNSKSKIQTSSELDNRSKDS